MTFRLQDHTEVQVPVRTARPTATFDDTMKGWQAELDSYYILMVEFAKMQPDEIFRHLSAFSARMNFIRTKIVRTDNKRWTNFRTKEIEPFLSECDRQFKIWSRSLSSYSLEFDMSKGF